MYFWDVAPSKIWGGGQYNVVGIICPLVWIELTDLPPPPPPLQLLLTLTQNKHDDTRMTKNIILFAYLKQFEQLLQNQEKWATIIHKQHQIKFEMHIMHNQSILVSGKSC